MYLFVLTGALLTWLNIHVEIGRHFFMDEGFMNSVIIIFVMYASSLSILTLESIPGEIGPQFFLRKNFLLNHIVPAHSACSKTLYHSLNINLNYCYHL